ncbi:MAG TPA: alpha-amylase family glycosyl hydrolase, partial [Methylococcales bacterium]
MSRLKVWAPNAVNVELVKGDDKSSFIPPINMVKTTITYKNVSISGYWELPMDINFPLKDGDGYWFKITFQNADVRYRIDPYARALHNSVSYSIYKDPEKFQWSDSHFVPPTFDTMVINQIFQGAYVGRGDADWKDPNGNNYHFEWDNKRKGDFRQLKNKLDYLQSLGVNTIELLPVNEYNGDDFLGYSSVSFFAIEASYGSVNGNGGSYDELKAFINEAHLRNI